jgi:hypothetical protein
VARKSTSPREALIVVSILGSPSAGGPATGGLAASGAASTGWGSLWGLRSSYAAMGARRQRFTPGAGLIPSPVIAHATYNSCAPFLTPSP